MEHFAETLQSIDTAQVHPIWTMIPPIHAVSIIWGQDESFMYVWILEETEMHTQEENQGNIKWGQESDIKDSFSHA